MARTDVQDWDAFVSYSRQDKAFVQRLTDALRHWRPPTALNGGRPLRIFLDLNDIEPGDYQREIEAQLARSRMLVAVCSPAARASRWVDDEIARFVRLRGADAVVPVLLAGLPANEAVDARAGDSAFPPALLQAIAMPLAVDYRGAAGADPRRGPCEPAWHQLLARLCGVAREVVEQRERQAQLRRWRTIALAGGALVAVLAGALVLTVAARNEAERQRDLAEQRRLAEQARALNVRAEAAQTEGGRGVERALLLAVESLRAAWTPEAQALLLQQLDRLPPPAAASAGDQRGPITALAAAPAQGWVASQGVDRLIVRSGSDLAPLHDLGRPRVAGAREIAFSPDGRWLVAGCPEQPACIWDTTSWRVARPLPSRGGLWSVAFSADSRQLAVVWNGARELTLMQGPDWREIAPLAVRETNSQPIVGAGFAADPRWLLVKTRSALEVHDLRQRRLHQVLDTRGGAAFALSPRRDRALVPAPGGGWQGVALTAGRDGAPALAFDGSGFGTGRGSRAARFSPGGQRVAAEAGDGRTEIHPAGHAPAASALAFADDEYLLSGSQAGRIEKLALARPEAAGAPGVDAAWPRALSPSGDSLAAVGDGRLTVQDLAQGRARFSLPAAAGEAPRYTADGRWLLLAGEERLRLLDASSGALRWASDGPARVDDAAVSPDGRWLLVLRDARELQRVALPEGRAATPLALPEPPEHVRISPDGRRLATISYASVSRGIGLLHPTIVRVWELDSGRELAWRSLEAQDLERHRGSTWARRASGAQGPWTEREGSGDLALADAALKWPEWPAAAAHRQPPGQPWLQALDARGAPAWKAAVARAERAHGAQVGEAAWSADGRWLATGARDGRVRLWGLDALALQAQACARARRELEADEWRSAFGDAPQRPTCASAALTR